MTGFFDEVKRRKVYRVAAAYIIAAGGAIQLASAAFPAWDLPNWALRLVIVLLLLGFPIALMLAWAYDITAEGIRVTPTIATPRSHRRRNIIMLVATGVIISAAAGFFLLPRVSARKIDKSIAVLPFQNLSDEKDLADMPPGVDPEGLVTFGWVQLFMLQRKFPEALATLKQLPQAVPYDDKPREFFEGVIYTFLNDKEKARSAFERARPIAEKALRESPDNAFRHVLLGQILAGLGKKEAAIAEGKRAVDLLPESQDALSGPKATLELAKIYTWTSETDHALQLLEHSLSTPSGITVPLLKHDPVWDPLRGHPRFQALLEKHDAKA